MVSIKVNREFDSIKIIINSKDLIQINFFFQQRRFNFFDEIVIKDPQDVKKNFDSLKLSVSKLIYLT